MSLNRCPCRSASKYITNAFSQYLGVMKLFFRVSGQGHPLIILHGLFGSSDNWHTLAKTFAQTFTVFLVDQRNHGLSPHSDDFNYQLLTDDLFEFVQANVKGSPFILGHSMGGKTAMNFAVKYPQSVTKLIVVDIAPRVYPRQHESILKGLMAVPLEHLQSRNEAEAILVNYVPDPAERQFLMKNLTRKTDGGFEWKINLKALAEHIDEIGSGMQYEGHFDNPTLFIKGARSKYLQNSDEDEIRKIFTHVQFKTLDSGHWVHAEKPKEFLEVVLAFLNQ
jgi:esterase